MNSLLIAFEFALAREREREREREVRVWKPLIVVVYGAFTSIWCKDFDLAGSVPEFKFLISVILFVFFATNVCLCLRVFFFPLSLGFLGFIVKLLVLGGYLFC